MANPSPAPTAPSPAGPGPNRLAREASPYLRQHADNPVDWYPWGEEAFARARAEDKPVFLSIGYSTCHWCHVMARESFEDPAIAALLNADFVSVKVDREERPDVDRLYMTFVQATTGSGGWPMSVWLQPDLKPFLGGTYFPPDDRHGRRGFPSVLRAIAQAWRQDRPQIAAQSERVLAALRELAARADPEDAAAPGPDGADRALPRAAAAQRAAFDRLAGEFDPRWGGFGGAPKFPSPGNLRLLARLAARGGPESASAREMLRVTLDRMAAGGIHDHLGGGFHRYAVDARWHVPHFEKMLYDQAQLAVVYLEAYQLTGRESYAAVVRGTLDYALRDLAQEGGAFASAEDADSSPAADRPEHVEGAFYVWTPAEVAAALAPPEADLFCRHYQVEPDGNVPAASDPHGELTGKSVLFSPEPLAAAAAAVGCSEADAAAWLARARDTLRRVRERRPRPHLDDKVLVAWNGLLISALARAARTLGEPRYLQAARQAAGFVRARLTLEDGRGLRRSYRGQPAAVAGFADDYAFFVQGLLDLYAADLRAADLLWAEQLQETMDQRFLDPADGGYFTGHADDPHVLVRLKEDHDGAEPAASSVAALNLLRLAALTGREEERRERALRTLRAFAPALSRIPFSLTAMLLALEAAEREPRQVVIVGAREAADTQALRRVVAAAYRPDDLAVVLVDDDEDRRRLAARLPHLETAGSRDGRATAYLCENRTCRLPTTDPAELARQLGDRA